MAEPLFLEERRRVILDQIEQKGRVTVKELSETLDVSEVTIRQDLRALQDQGLLDRTYGGAVARGGGANNLKELSFNIRQMKMRRQKDAIAAAAAAMIRDGYSIALDSSTTVCSLIPFLSRFERLTVVTNSLVIAHSFLSDENPDTRVLVVGGRLRRDAISVVGMPESVPNINLNLGFFSARGFAQSVGVSEIDPDEVAVKRAMMARCVQPIFLIDGSKWGQISPYTIVPAAEIRHIITSDDAPADQIEYSRAMGIRVDVVRA
ncbi:MAG: DeoR/GlpR transcriptional regulator [Chloroflexi bacterium]|nr:DeoR/GlpR transcriptional regulator [Chloroflexota bacterium]